MIGLSRDEIMLLIGCDPNKLIVKPRVYFYENKEKRSKFQFQRPCRAAGGLGGDTGAAIRGLRSLLTGRDKYSANCLP